MKVTPLAHVCDLSSQRKKQEDSVEFEDGLGNRVWSCLMVTSALPDTKEKNIK